MTDSKKGVLMKSGKKRISLIITIWLVVIVMLACAASAALTYLVFSKRAEEQSEALVKQNAEDVSHDIDEVTDASILSFMDQIIAKNFITSAKIENPGELSELMQAYYPGMGIEVNVVDANGIIVALGNFPGCL